MQYTVSAMKILMIRTHWPDDFICKEQRNHTQRTQDEGREGSGGEDPRMDACIDS